MTGLETIPKRRDFVLVSTHGRRYAMPGLVLQMRDRGDDAGARLGITASKKIGNAVKRNWCKRVTRILVGQLDLTDLTKDLYINVIARKFMIKENFSILRNDFNYSIKKIVKYEKKSK